MCSLRLFSSCFSSDRPKRATRSSSSTTSVDGDNRNTTNSNNNTNIPLASTTASAGPSSLAGPAALPQSTLFSRHPRQADDPSPPNNMAPPRGTGIRKKTARPNHSAAGGHKRGYFNGGASPAAGSSSAAPTSDAKLEKMFDELRDAQADLKDSLGVESTMNYLTGLGLDPESGEIFVALELVKAPNFGEITRAGFVDGWKDTGVPATKTAQANHVRQRINVLSKDPTYFKLIYRYTFTAGKEADQRALSVENAVAFWRALFSPPAGPWRTASRDWLDLWTAFMAAKWTRSVNRDMWNQVLEFATKTMDDPTLAFWAEDGAWPSVIDEFVKWFRESEARATADAMVTDN